MSQIIRSKSDLKDVVQFLKRNNTSIGLVATMGALHQGHMALVAISAQTYDVTIATIFVNPVQFNNKDDFSKYPKTEMEDIEKLNALKCDYIFIPSADEIYEKEPLTRLSFGYLEQILEGKHRPGHFNGVGLVVMKLFGLIEPNGAFFGQKDLQQFSIISSLVRDFDMPIKLHLVPIVREKSGLALSSRNRRLSKVELVLASSIFAILQNAGAQLMRGENATSILDEARTKFNEVKGIKLEYFEIVDAESLINITTPNEGDRLALCAAAIVGEIRLIDNIIIEI